jgi:hypothetical protein
VGNNDEPDCSQLPVDHECGQQHMQDLKNEQKQLSGTNDQLADKDKQLAVPCEQQAENQEQLDAPNEKLVQSWAKFDLEQATDQGEQLAANHDEQVGGIIKQPGEAKKNLLETGKQMIVSFVQQ